MTRKDKLISLLIFTIVIIGLYWLQDIKLHNSCNSETGCYDPNRVEYEIACGDNRGHIAISDKLYSPKETKLILWWKSDCWGIPIAREKENAQTK